MLSRFGWVVLLVIVLASVLAVVFQPVKAGGGEEVNGGGLRRG